MQSELFTSARPYGSWKRGGSVLVQQLHQLRRLTPRRFTLREGQIQKRFAVRRGLLQAANGRGVERFAFDLEHRVLMRGIEHGLVAIIAANMTSDLDRTIQNAHAGIGGKQG